MELTGSCSSAELRPLVQGERQVGGRLLLPPVQGEQREEGGGAARGQPPPSVSPCPHLLQVVRAKERLDEELRIQAKDEKEKGGKGET